MKFQHQIRRHVGKVRSVVDYYYNTDEEIFERLISELNTIEGIRNKQKNVIYWLYYRLIQQEYNFVDISGREYKALLIMAGEEVPGVLNVESTYEVKFEKYKEMIEKAKVQIETNRKCF